MDESRRSYGWVVVAVGGLMGCMAVGAMFSLAVFLQPMTQDTGWSQWLPSGEGLLAFSTLLRNPRHDRPNTNLRGFGDSRGEVCKLIGLHLGRVVTPLRHADRRTDAVGRSDFQQIIEALEALGFAELHELLCSIRKNNDEHRVLLATSTRPLSSKVAVKKTRPVFIAPVVVHVSVFGSYNSALARPLPPPATSTSPLRSKVAV